MAISRIKQTPDVLKTAGIMLDNLQICDKYGIASFAESSDAFAETYFSPDGEDAEAVMYLAQETLYNAYKDGDIDEPQGAPLTYYPTPAEEDFIHKMVCVMVSTNYRDLRAIASMNPKTFIQWIEQNYDPDFDYVGEYMGDAYRN